MLISQNRTAAAAAAAAAAADKRADLDLQINLLAEHELTKLTKVVAATAAKLDVPLPHEEIAEITRDVAPGAVLDELEASSAHHERS